MFCLANGRVFRLRAKPSLRAMDGLAHGAEDGRGRRMAMVETQNNVAELIDDDCTTNK